MKKKITILQAMLCSGEQIFLKELVEMALSLKQAGLTIQTITAIDFKTRFATDKVA